MQAAGYGRPVVLDVSRDTVVVVWALGCSDRPGERVELQDRPNRLIEQLHKIAVIVLISAAVDFHLGAKSDIDVPAETHLVVKHVAVLSSNG